MIPTSPRMRLRALVGLMSFAASAVACSDDGSATTPTPVGTVEAVIPVGSRPLPLAGGFGAIWIRNGDGDVVRVDSVTNDVVATLEVGGAPYGYITTGEGSVWVARFDNDDVARIDPLTDSVVAEISVGSAPEGVAVTPGAVWVANHHDGTISRIDPATNSVVSTIRVG